MKTNPAALFTLVGCVGLAACSAAPEGKWIGDIVTANDYEAAAGWVPGATSVTRDHAHSGRFADHVDATHNYGLTYQSIMAEASVHPLRGLDLEAWAYVAGPPPQTPAVVQVQVWAHGPGQDPAPLFSEGLALAALVPDSSKWTRVRQRFQLPPNLPYDANLRIFLAGNGCRRPVYLDDIRVKALE